jgi:hypothetical protein
MRNDFHKKLLATVCTLALVISPALNPYEAQAATQGTAGSTSTGSIDIKVKKDARVKISGLTDLQQASWEASNGDVVLTEDFCVYSTRALGGYKVNAQGSGSANAFALANGTDTLPYSVKWNDGGAGALAAPTVALTPNSLSSVFQHASTVDPGCSGGNTARLEVRVTAAQMASAVDGEYAGTLTLIVSPS